MKLQLSGPSVKHNYQFRLHAVKRRSTLTNWEWKWTLSALCDKFPHMKWCVESRVRRERAFHCNTRFWKCFSENTSTWRGSSDGDRQTGFSKTGCTVNVCQCERSQSVLTACGRSRCKVLSRRSRDTPLALLYLWQIILFKSWKLSNRLPGQTRTTHTHTHTK